MITWNNVTVKLGSLKPWSDNPRYTTKAQAKRLLESWKALGQFQTIAISPDGDVYDGHQRLSALLTVYGENYEVAARQSSRPLDDTERRRLVIAANLAVGNWDWDSLASWDYGMLRDAGFDRDQMRAWRRDAQALKELEFEGAEGDEFATSAGLSAQAFRAVIPLTSSQFGDIELKERIIEAIAALGLRVDFEKV